MVEGLQEKELVEQERRPASQDDERVTAKKGKQGESGDCRPKWRFGVSDLAFYLQRVMSLIYALAERGNSRGFRALRFAAWLVCSVEPGVWRVRSLTIK
jgi:hypothetical protein